MTTKKVVSVQEMVLKKNAVTHTILLATKFYNKPITIEDLKVLNAKKYPNMSRIKRSMLHLESSGMIYFHDPITWSITSKGKNFLTKYAREHKSKLEKNGTEL
jgi:ribosomal protein S19E (S16A)